jgi:hypothetical protein
VSTTPDYLYLTTKIHSSNKKEEKKIGCPGILQEALTNLFEIRSSHEFRQAKEQSKRQKNLTLTLAG